MLGGAPEVESRAAAPGGDETGRCAAFTKDTKNHEGTRRLQRGGTADYADWSRLGAGYRRQDCQNGLEITKDTKDTKVFG